MQEEDDEESASLGDVLDILVKKWPKGFSPLELAKMVNDPTGISSARTPRRCAISCWREEEHFISEKSVGRLLKQHLDAAVPSGLVLRKTVDTHTRAVTYHVERLKGDG